MGEFCFPYLPLIGSLCSLVFFLLEFNQVSADLFRSDCNRVGRFSSVHKDHSLQSHVVQTLHLSHVVDCTVACMEHALCKSYNFHITQDSHNICELSDSTKNESSTDFVSRSGYTYYDTGSAMRHGPNCHSSPCLNNESCFETCNPSGYRCVPYSVKFEKTTETVSESGVSVQVQVQVTGLRSVPVTIQVNSKDVTANAPDDYTQVSTSVTFLPSDVEKLVDVLISSDSKLEGNETFSLILANTGSGEAADGHVINITIIDDDTSVDFVKTTETVSESGVPLQVQVQIGGIRGGPVTVQVNSADISATAPNDYTAVSTSITFLPSDVVKSVDVSVSPDSKIEADETFSLILTPADSDVTTENNIIHITITDDSVGTISMESAEEHVLESASTLKLGVLFPEDNFIAVSARVTVSSDSATVGQDFSLPVGTVTFSSGSTREEVTINIIDDSSIEAVDAETFTVTLETTDPKLAVSSSDQTKVYIEDDDAPDSCQKVKDFGKSTGDGEYNLYLQRPSCSAPARVYCVDMNTDTPLEYVTLPAGRSENYGMNNRRPGHESHKHGKTAFDKIRLKLPDRKVQLDDRRFAARVEGNVDQKYGFAGNCRHGSCGSYPSLASGRTKADLTGTDFRFPSTIPYKVGGWPACAQKMHSPSMSSNRKRWTVKCGGYCGGCYPNPLILSVDAC